MNSRFKPGFHPMPLLAFPPPQQLPPLALPEPMLKEKDKSCYPFPPPQGHQGPQGPQGPQGHQGLQGPRSKIARDCCWKKVDGLGEKDEAFEDMFDAPPKPKVRSKTAEDDSDLVFMETYALLGKHVLDAIGVDNKSSSGVSSLYSASTSAASASISASTSAASASISSASTDYKSALSNLSSS
jgi:hypothetical protein